MSEMRRLVLLLSFQFAAAACPAGQVLNAGVCTLCSVGTYTSTGVECIQCRAGWSSWKGASACYQCPTGTYNPTDGGACIKTPIDTCAPDYGYSAPVSCPPDFLPCPAGQARQTGDTQDPLFGFCLSCAAGTYSAGGIQCIPCGPGTSSSKQAGACYPCPKGTYGAGGNCTQNPINTCTPDSGYSQPVACPPNFTTCPLGRAALAGVCAPCSKGSFSPGGVECTLCGAGTSSDLGASACYPCPPGTYGAAEGGNCTKTPINTYTDESGSSQPVACALHREYQTREGMTECMYCHAWYPGLTMLPAEHAQECPYICNPGYTLRLLEAYCTPCPEGTYSAGVEVAAGVQNARCVPCGAGFSSYAGSHAEADCYPCPAGAYQPLQAGVCVESPGNTYTPGTGYSSVLNCSAATYNEGGLSYCMDCQPWNEQTPPAETAICRDFCSGGQTKPPGGSTCIPCPPGTYSVPGMNPVCLPCGFGNSSVAGASSCFPCPAGTYGPNHNGSCVPCRASTFSEQSGMKACTKCSQNTFGVWAGLSEGFLACSMSYAFPNWGGNLYYTKVCAQGQFNRHYTFEGTDNDPVDLCVSCEPGTYNPDARNTYTASCPPCDCPCLPCRAGTFSGVESTACGNCPANTYSLERASACTMCSPGYVSIAQSSTCMRACLAGSYPVGDACVPSPAGSYVPMADYPAPLQCPTGSYNTASGLTYCTACAAGKWGTVVAATSEAVACPNTMLDTSARYTTCTGGVSCVAGRCGAGMFKNPLDRACTACPAGTYQPTPPTVWAPYQFTFGTYYTVRYNGNTYYNQSEYADVKWSNVVRFHFLEIGTHPRGPMWRQFSNPAQPLMTYLITMDLADTIVNGNRYVDRTYATFVNDPLCLKNGVWNCTDGEWLPAALLYSSPDVAINYPCPPCPPGTFGTQTGAMACTPCDANLRQSSLEGSTSCSVCVAGHYKAADTCVICPPGFYCSTAATAPVACPGGYFCSGYGISAPVSCPPGNTCPAASVNPMPCPAGKICFGYRLQTFTHTCPVGEYCPPGSSVGTACPIGNTCPAAGMSAPLPCAPGYCCQARYLTAPNLLCPPGTFCPGGCTIDPTPCPVGSACPQSGASAPTPCAVGFWCTVVGLSVMGPCPAGFYCMQAGTGNTAVPCNAGKYCPSGSTAQQVCQPGFFCGGRAAAMTPCTAGYYCPKSGMVTPTPVPSTYYSPSTGLSALMPCPAGYRCPSAALSQAVPCGKGFYCPSVRTLFPTTCVEGYHCPYDAMSAPLLCSIGYYCPAAASAMVECPAGYICPVQGMTTPDPCPELVNGNFIGTGQHVQNMCLLFQCSLGYYITPENQLQLPAQCSLTAEGLDQNCALFLAVVCEPVPLTSTTSAVPTTSTTQKSTTATTVAAPTTTSTALSPPTTTPRATTSTASPPPTTTPQATTSTASPPPTTTPHATTSTASPPPTTTPQATTSAESPPNSTTAPPTTTTVASVSVGNTTIAAVLCAAPTIAAALSNAYARPVSILGAITATESVDCPFFVCPCGRRRLAAVGGVVVQIIFQHAACPVNESAVVANLQTVLGANVFGLATLDTKLDDGWNSVSLYLPSEPADYGLVIIVLSVVVGAAFVCGCVILLVSRRKRHPKPLPTELVVPQPFPPRADLCFVAARRQ